MFRVLRALMVIFLTACLLSWPAKADNSPVTVFAAASLKDVLEAAGKAFTASGGVDIRFSFAASSALAKQIESGAPADLFASADIRWMDYVADKKLIRSETRTHLLGNRLVVIAPAASPVSLVEFTGASFANALGNGRLIVSDVVSVPAGIYAKAALQKMGLWEGLEPRLAQTENVRSALAFVARGEAPLGVVYETDAKVEANVKIVAVFPDDSHEPIIYPFAVTNSAKGEGASQFMAFLRGPSARTIFERAGFPVLLPALSP